MKVVINDCYGGFMLSKEAILYLIKKKSDIIKKMSIEEYTGGKIKTVKEALEGKDFMMRLIPFKDGFYGQVINGNLFKGKWVYMGIDDDNKIRAHPDIIEVVEKLGDKANTSVSKLKIVEIPDDVDWEIKEYDGEEWIAEKHKVWR